MERETKVGRLDWVEPAHPGILRFREDLRALSGRIREKYQGGIDGCFDKVARQIGFVVATVLPATFEIGQQGQVKEVAFTSENLADTLFYHEFSKIFKALRNKDDPVPVLTAGSYELPLIWFNALQLRLRADWMEPVHQPFHLHCKRWEVEPPPSRDWLEPVHPPLPWHWRCAEWEFDRPYWLDWVEPAHVLPGQTAPSLKPDPTPWKEKITLEVLDEVYPELALLERIAKMRASMRRQIPAGIKEPAHFRVCEKRLPREALLEIDAILKRHKKSTD